MSISSVNQMSGVKPMNQQSQDSYEKNIQKQITNLQEKVKNLAYDRELSEEQKQNEKKELQEQIQSLNSELKQHQIQKKQEEAAERQEPIGIKEKAETSGDRPEEESEEIGFGDAETGVIISISHNREQLDHMRKVRVRLEGQLRTADTEEEKRELQKRINNVSKSMGEKVQKIADTIADNLKEEQERKDKVGEIQKRQEREKREKQEAVNVVLPTGGKHKLPGNQRRGENFTLPGKVSIS